MHLHLISLKKQTHTIALSDSAISSSGEPLTLPTSSSLDLSQNHTDTLLMQPLSSHILPLVPVSGDSTQETYTDYQILFPP